MKKKTVAVKRSLFIRRSKKGHNARASRKAARGVTRGKRESWERLVVKSLLAARRKEFRE